jgi:hypothetical protein
MNIIICKSRFFLQGIRNYWSKARGNLVALYALVVSVLVIGHKVRGFKSGEGSLIFKGDKSPQHALLRKGSKLSAPCRKILWHVNEPFEV